MNSLFELLDGDEPVDPRAAIVAPRPARRKQIDFNPEEFDLSAPLQGEIFTRDQIIDEAFAWFRQQGFPYKNLPRFVMMQQINALASAPSESLRNTTEAYSVADTFHPHRFHAKIEGKYTPIECFNHDVKFRHALSLRLQQVNNIPAGFFGHICLSRNTQQASNFRPGFACELYRRFCKPGAVVLDTSTGYGGRLVGFMASRVGGRYIGIDPSTKTHQANTAMAASLGFAEKVELYNVPAEDMDVELVRNRCDFSFTSPPYFSKEHYADEETQSWKRYGESFHLWTMKFLRPMLALTYAALKPNCHAIVNVEDVNIRNRKHPLVEETIDAAERAGFKHVGTELFEMVARLGEHQEDGTATEHVLIFTKS